MNKFTKEQLQQIAETDHVQCGDAAAMARQMLAGLEQEPVAEVLSSRAGNDTSTIDKALTEGLMLYAAPQLPQPAVPDEMEDNGNPHDEENQAYVGGWNACRAAMLQGAEPVSQPYTLRDGWVAVPVDMAPEMMRAVQINSELGAYAAANLTGAYSLFREFWDVAIAAAPQQEDL